MNFITGQTLYFLYAVAIYSISIRHTKTYASRNQCLLLHGYISTNNQNDGSHDECERRQGR